MRVNIFNTDKKYQIIYADPPWEYKESGSGNRVIHSKYSTMSTQDICNLPVSSITDETAILFIWGTFPKLEECLKVIKSWGFEYYGLGFNWIKTNQKSNTLFWGMGYYTRQNSEICLIGVRKNKKNRIKPKVRNILSVIHSIKREHSRKPDEVRDMIVDICGDLPRIELFSRQIVDKWDSWGNEIKF
ncbi:TPA: DNA methyltransferase [Pasteurella multocida]|nr:DNA methyltransferase [Pasteurella multocida]